MAKGRKPAIDGLARPQGVLDDIVRPIIQKGARAVSKASKSPSVKVKAAQVSAKVGTKRAVGYNKQAQKLAGKASEANMKEQFRKSERLATRSLVASNKSVAAFKMGSVRKTAESARAGAYKSKRVAARDRAYTATIAAKRRAGIR
jgi:hypothetical protein